MPIFNNSKSFHYSYLLYNMISGLQSSSSEKCNWLTPPNSDLFQDKCSSFHIIRIQASTVMTLVASSMSRCSNAIPSFTCIGLSSDLTGICCLYSKIYMIILFVYGVSHYIVAILLDQKHKPTYHMVDWHPLKAFFLVSLYSSSVCSDYWDSWFHGKLGHGHPLQVNFVV